MKKVYCNDCKYFGGDPVYPHLQDCKSPGNTKIVNKLASHYSLGNIESIQRKERPIDLNKNNNCKEYRRVPFFKRLFG